MRYLTAAIVLLTIPLAFAPTGEQQRDRTVTFQSLPDGTNYTASTVLSIPKDNLEVTTENSNYQKTAPSAWTQNALGSSMATSFEVPARSRDRELLKKGRKR